MLSVECCVLSVESSELCNLQIKETYAIRVFHFHFQIKTGSRSLTKEPLEHGTWNVGRDYIILWIGVISDSMNESRNE